MDRLFASLSPEELYEHLQSLDDGERTIRVVGNSALLPSLGAVYKLLHTSRGVVWDAMRSGRPSLPVAKTLAKAWNTPGVHLGRSATIRLLTAGRDAGLAEALSYFGGLDYLRPRANEWTGLFASGLFSQDVSKQFWVGFVQEVMHLNALELHSDLGRLRQWDGTNTFGTDVRFRPNTASGSYRSKPP